MPAVRSASTAASWIACDACLTSTTTPLRSPWLGAMPTPRMRICPFSAASPIRTQVLVVPTSIAATMPISHLLLPTFPDQKLKTSRFAYGRFLEIWQTVSEVNKVDLPVRPEQEVGHGT